MAQDFEKASVSDLVDSDVEVEKQDSDYVDFAKKHSRKVIKHESRRVKQAHKHRKQIFSFSIWASTFVMVFSTTIVVLSLAVPNWRFDNSVYVAYISGNAVQFVGLLTVVAKYAFSDQAVSKVFSMNQTTEQ